MKVYKGGIMRYMKKILIILSLLPLVTFIHLEARGGGGGGGHGGGGHGGGGHGMSGHGVGEHGDYHHGDYERHNDWNRGDGNLYNGGYQGLEYEMAPPVEPQYDVDTNPGDTDYGDSMIDGPQVDGAR
jgi:hypothetical protein